MKIILHTIVFLIIAFVVYPQEMVIQKTDGSNLKMDLSLIDKINFIIPCPETPTVDYGGKTYNTVLIGTQCWMKENLDIGTMVTGSQTNNSVIEKYCYDNDTANCKIYGGLYYWDEAMQYVSTEGAQGICPNGWHIPAVAEVQALIDYVGSDGNAYKREDQGTGDGLGTNTSGFSALLNGGKYYSSFNGLDANARFWIGKLGSCSYECFYTLEFFGTTSDIHFDQGTMTVWAMGVRCIKD